ncbi:DMP19 family protein [Paenibacillus anseongense]
MLLILDFDIELQMNGIIGFLENSSGAYLEETMEALFRIRAT